MSTDRDLLELAAKAAGYKALEWHRETPREGGSSVDVLYVGQCEAFRPFRPLEDDGDALRLAVKLEIDITFFSAFVEAEANRGHAAEPREPDRLQATRRAIVRAAAEIGKQ